MESNISFGGFMFAGFIFLHFDFSWKLFHIPMN
jgi:hypothetical protein